MASVNTIVKQRSRESKDKRECTMRGRCSVFNPRATTITIATCIVAYTEGATIDLSLRWNSRIFLLSMPIFIKVRGIRYGFSYFYIFYSISNKFFDSIFKLIF